jgi:hypothetical protein
MLFQPIFGLKVLRTKTFHFGPEFGAMVEMAQVGQFMEQNIVRYGGRKLEEPPIQGNGAASGTTAPACSLRSNGDSTDFLLQSVDAGPFQKALGKFLFRQRLQLSFNLLREGSAVGVELK